MTPQETAKALVEKFREQIPPTGDDRYPAAIQCAIICAYEILPIAGNVQIEAHVYWVDVIKELKKL